MSLKKTRVYKDKETGEIIREEIIEEVKVYRTDVGAAKGMASELAKILLPSGGRRDHTGSEGVPDRPGSGQGTGQ